MRGDRGGWGTCSVDAPSGQLRDVSTSGLSGSRARCTPQALEEGEPTCVLFYKISVRNRDSSQGGELPRSLWVIKGLINQAQESQVRHPQTAKS